MNEAVTCKCGRPIMIDDATNKYVHQDGRVKHEVIIVVPDVQTDPVEVEPEVLTLAEESDESLMAAAERVFPDGAWVDAEDAPFVGEEEELVPAEAVTDEQDPDQTRETKPSPVPPSPVFGTPSRDDFVNVKGGVYLPARRRIMWMRGDVEPHPGWTIDTYTEEIERGKYINNNRVEGGYARYRANVFDETGRLIATGTKTEWSERFMDFAEKAETGAIARALAVAGYGTEAALDIDEGLEEDRIADAPVPGRAINITSSAVTGLVQGGRSQNITAAQFNEIQRLVRVSGLGIAFLPLVENVLQVTVPELDPSNPTGTVDAFLGDLTFEEAATLIRALNAAMKSSD